MEYNIINTLKRYDSMLMSTLMDSDRYKHTHPPIRGIEGSCLYCRIHGNVFSDGVKKTNSDELCQYVIPITNVREEILLR